MTQRDMKYQISNGGTFQPRPVYGKRRNDVERESHALAVKATEGDTAKHSPLAWWATDIRRGRRNVWGSILGVITRLHDKGYPMETVLMFPRLLEAFIRDLYESKPAPAVAVPVTLLRTGDIEREAA